MPILPSQTFVGLRGVEEIVTSRTAYIGLTQQIDVSSLFFLNTPVVCSLGLNKRDVIEETRRDIHDGFKLSGKPRLRGWVLEARQGSSRCVVEWVAAPVETLLAEQDYDAGTLSSKRFREDGAAFSRPLQKTNHGTERVINLNLGPSPDFDLSRLGQEDVVTYLGLHQLYNPEAETSVLPPTVLALGPDEQLVKTVVQSAYDKTSQLSSVSFQNFWVLDCHTHHSFPMETWRVFPDYIPTAEI